MDLFENSTQNNNSLSPLAEQIRPASFKDLIGLEKVIGRGTPIGKMLENRKLKSLILWGPPGCGKTTLARLLANGVDGHFFEENAVELGVKKIRELGQTGKRNRIDLSQASILFVDEIHRLNKGQQDVLLPFVESGDLVLIGATTENPSYEVNSALLSRCRLTVLEKLKSEDLRILAEKVFSRKEFDVEKDIEPEALKLLLQWSDGDARKLINSLDELLDVVESGNLPINGEFLKEALQSVYISYDKNSDQHFDCISAFIKSIRGSDPQAAVYYLARMLKGGEDPKYIARRLVILASEDVGNADPRGLELAVSGFKAVEVIGMPEARIILSQVTTYLASAPKSNRAYAAIGKAFSEVEKSGTLPIPLHLRSAQTKAMKDLGYGRDYVYTQDGPTGWLDQEYLPEEISDRVFYEPSSRGFEKNIGQYLDWMKGRMSDQSKK